MRIVPVVNFDWEPKYYNGNLLSVSAKYMAYAIRGILTYNKLATAYDINLLNMMFNGLFRQIRFLCADFK